MCKTQSRRKKQILNNWRHLAENNIVASPAQQAMFPGPDSLFLTMPITTCLKPLTFQFILRKFSSDLITFRLKKWSSINFPYSNYCYELVQTLWKIWWLALAPSAVGILVPARLHILFGRSFLIFLCFIIPLVPDAPLFLLILIQHFSLFRYFRFFLGCFFSFEA